MLISIRKKKRMKKTKSKFYLTINLFDVYIGLLINDKNTYFFIPLKVFFQWYKHLKNYENGVDFYNNVCIKDK